MIAFLDGGRGADPTAAVRSSRGGVGLRACAERLAAAGGRIERIERIGLEQGFGVRVVRPLEPTGAAAARA